MLLKLNPAITKLNLYDIVHTPGVAADLSHIESRSKVKGFVGDDQLEESLSGAEVGRSTSLAGGGFLNDYFSWHSDIPTYTGIKTSF